MNMIRTENEKNYGQLEAQAEGNADVEAFVFQNGEIVPAGQTQNATAPVIRTAAEPNVEAFVFRNGEVVPAYQAQDSNTPVINTAPEKNYAR